MCQPLVLLHSLSNDVATAPVHAATAFWERLAAFRGGGVGEEEEEEAEAPPSMLEEVPDVDVNGASLR